MTDTQPDQKIQRDREEGDGQRRPDQGSDAAPAPAQTDTGPATSGAGAGGPGGFGHMTMRIYEVAVSGRDGATRVVKVPSKTDVQAGDAAATLMSPGESILSIRETDDPLQDVDAMPPGTQTHPDRPV